MTQITNPFEAAFEMQREAMKQSQGLLQQSLDLQQNAIEAFMYNGINAQRSAQRQGVNLMQQLFNAQLDAAESAMDDDEVRATLDRQFEQNAEMTQELMNAQFEQGAEVTQQLYNDQLDAFEQALNDDEFRTAFNNQFRNFENTQQRAWDEFESEFGDTFEELSDRQKQLVAETVNAALSAQRETEQETIEGVRAAESVTEDATAEAEAVAEKTQEQLAEDVRTRQNGDHEDLEVIDGLGDEYAQRLRNSGIKSLNHLAQADASAVAEAADISEDHAGEWVSSAQAKA